MFQPHSRTAKALTPRALALGAVGLLVIVIAVVLLVRHSTSSSPTSTTPPPQQLKGAFTKTTMTCPGKAVAPGAVCLIDVNLEANVDIHVRWTGPGLIGIGVRDSHGTDVGPQITGEHGDAHFYAMHLAAGKYELRVVNVSVPPDPFTFLVTITNDATLTSATPHPVATHVPTTTRATARPSASGKPHPSAHTSPTSSVAPRATAIP